ncbi:twin-arginine translocase TatA/TatE family subunit [Xanthobacteraceae bacterium A53D]
MGSMSIWHWIVVLAVVLLLFGRGKISDLMGDVAKGIKSFKKGMAEDDEAPKKDAAAPEAPRPLPHQASPAPEAEKKPV